MDSLLDLLIGFIIGLFWGVWIGINMAQWAIKQRFKRLRGELND
jgi:ABC-type nitrate/sulfonate/bicarbonate transport system permease component